jgi:hypothetical protein
MEAQEDPAPANDPPVEPAGLAEFASHTLAYLRRLDEKLDRVDGRLDRVDGRLERVEGRLERIEDELLVLKDVGLRLEGREVETTGVKRIPDRHERALALLDRRMAELEDAKA